LLISKFRSSPEFKALRPATRRNYDRYLAMMSETFGHMPLGGLQARHVYAMRDAMAGTPGKANNFLKILKALLAFGVSRGSCSTNVAAGIKTLKIGEHEPWPQDVLDRALKAAPPTLKLAIMLGFFTGQRISDVIRMRHDWHDGRIMRLVQQKTGKPVAVPMHAELLKAISFYGKKSDTILVDRSGRPFTSPEPIQAQMRRLMKEIGADYTFHGLRKNAANALAEMRMTTHEIKAITGMSLEMIEHYTKRAAVGRLAEGVVRADFDNLVLITGGNAPVPAESALAES
jgi:integrase